MPAEEFLRKEAAEAAAIAIEEEKVETEKADKIVKRRGHVIALTRTAFVVVIIVAVTFLAAGAYFAYESYNNSRLAKTYAKQALGQSDKNGQAADILKDCLIPPGECYTRLQEQNSGIIKQLAVTQIAAAWCGIHENTLSDQNSCVAKTVVILNKKN